jgi:hypothetical protein
MTFEKFYIGKRPTPYISGGSTSTAAITTLIPAGHFSNLTAPALTSLTDQTYSSNFSSLTGTRSSPTKFKTLTVSGCTIKSTSVGSTDLWLDTLIMSNSAVIDTSGENGTDGTSIGGNYVGGNGGKGGAGGGGGSAIPDGADPLDGGLGGPVFTADPTNGASGASTDPAVAGTGGTGFARNGAGGGYLADTSPFSNLPGGNGGEAGGGCGGCSCQGTWGVPLENGYGSGGNGGFANPSCGAGVSCGGGGGGGSKNNSVIKELIITNTTGTFRSNGGNGGQGFNGGNNGDGGGGGPLQLFICKASNATLSRLRIETNGGEGYMFGSNGNFAVYEISKTGTILHTYSNTIPSVGWDHT